MISDQNPFSDIALLNLLLPAHNRKKYWELVCIASLEERIKVALGVNFWHPLKVCWSIAPTRLKPLDFGKEWTVRNCHTGLAG